MAVPGTDPFVFASIVGMPEYSNSSVEELRFRDYAAGRKGSGKTWNKDLWFDPSMHSAFGDAAARLKNSAVKTQGTETLPYQCKVELGPEGPVKHSSIVLMDTYRDFSVEELRIIDYRAGRTHRTAAQVFRLGVPPPKAFTPAFGSSASAQDAVGFGSTRKTRVVWEGFGAISSTLSNATGTGTAAPADKSSALSNATTTMWQPVAVLVQV
ncbi:hypothetical protein BCR44DRAFT_1097710 [Catenaria anguillulae PL171]|uniref:Uncharacterized protein n=1 Tax=Catenaria anguillulae PL171 TaxID=765915 RepID=A0A1Y2I1N7_9FUNG|nr:hypothetical protein BCR44DRAFT_1097710 [Catenaria anguillulae PL171]